MNSFSRFTYDQLLELCEKYFSMVEELKIELEKTKQLLKVHQK